MKWIAWVAAFGIGIVSGVFAETQTRTTGPSPEVAKVSGTVEAYAVGKTLTLTRADGSRITYVIDDESEVPDGLAVGKSVAVLAMPSDSVVRTVTFVTGSVENRSDTWRAYAPFEDTP
jgi:hypothetical protein